MRWWSAKRKDYKPPLAELANTTSSVQGITKRGTNVQARGAFTHFLNGDARCGSKPAL